MAARSNMVAILPIYDMPKWRFTIVIDIFLYEKNLNMILNMSGQYQLVHFENSIDGVLNVLQRAKWPFFTQFI